MKASWVISPLVALSLLGIGFSAEARGNEKVVETLLRLGADLERDDDGNIVSVDWSWSYTVTGPDLALLKELPRLSELDLSEIRFSRVSLTHLAALSNLKYLGLSDTKFTDADIRHLEGFTSLERLDLSGTSVTDASVASLAALPRLERVSLGSTRVTPDGLRALREKRPDLHVGETWEYSVSVIAGYGVLSTDRVTFVFHDIRGPVVAGGSAGGSSIEVSLPRAGDDDSRSFSGGVASANGIRATSCREEGIPTIRVYEHRIQVLGGGTEVSVDGHAFRLGSEKLRILVLENGEALLDRASGD